MDDYPEITQRTNDATGQGIKVKEVGIIDNILHIEIATQHAGDLNDIQYAATYASLLFKLEIHGKFDQVTIRDATAGETKEYDRLQALSRSPEAIDDVEEQYHK